MDHLVQEEAGRCYEGCEMDNPSQIHHDCMMSKQEDIWICHYEKAKEYLEVDKLWSAIEDQIRKNQMFIWRTYG